MKLKPCSFCDTSLIGVLIVVCCIAINNAQANLTEGRRIHLSHCDPKKVSDVKARAALEAADAAIVRLPAVEIPERGKVPVRLKNYRCDITRANDDSYEIFFQNKEVEAWIDRQRRAGREYLGGSGLLRATGKNGKVLDAGIFQ